MPITPTPGTAAQAAGFTLVVGSSDLRSDVDDLINRLADQVVALAMKNIRGIPYGGTGGDTPAAARAALGALAAADLPIFDDRATANTAVKRRSDGATDFSAVYVPQDPPTTDALTRDGYVKFLCVIKGTDSVMTAQLFLPNAYAASSGYSVAYIDGSGRIAKNASSRRWKYRIRRLLAGSLGDLFVEGFRSYVMRGDKGRMTRYGEIAEDLDQHEATRPFVTYEREQDIDDDGNVTGHHLKRDEEGNPIPEGVDFIALHGARIFQLHERLRVVEDALGIAPTTGGGAA